MSSLSYTLAGRTAAPDAHLHRRPWNRGAGMIVAADTRPKVPAPFSKLGLTISKAASGRSPERNEFRHVDGGKRPLAAAASIRILSSSMSQVNDARPRTFVVDDELDIAKLMVVILQMNLFDAIPFSDPKEALEAAKSEPPEFLISDIVMPEMNGIELATAVQEAVPACKVLLFSGQVGATELIEQSAAAGRQFQLVQKPIHPTELVAALRAL